MAERSTTMDTNKIERLNNEMFASRPNYVKPLVILAVIILTLVIGFALTVKSAHAASVTAKENTYHVAGLFGDCMADSAKEDFYSTPDDYCQVYPSVGNGKQVHTAKNPVKSAEPIIPAVIVEDTAPEDSTPIVTPPSNDNPSNPPVEVHEDSKPKCNNGEGNGSEGCSPAKSPNANNDENNTTPKQDKSKQS
jgi:hypothetical protein